MTKVSVFGQNATELKELKPIELIKSLDGGFNFYISNQKASHYNNVMLFEKNYGQSGFDLIFAWNDIDDKVIFIGHWNDGVV